MVAYALEAPPELLPFLPELLADLEELGSDARQIARILRTLALPPTARVVDLGSGKGAVAVEIASALQLHVLGIDLFEPFVAHANASARAAGVSHLCEFRRGDVRTMSQELRPADVAVLAALGDVLGDPAETMRIVRDFVRPGAFVLVADVFLREGGSVGFPGFEHYRSRAETVRALTAWGDSLVREVEATGDGDSDEDASAIRRRAAELAKRHPEHREKFLAFAAHQAQANAYIAENLSDVVWVLQRAAS
jgi:SAM-dependent methyltransferase